MTDLAGGDDGRALGHMRRDALQILAGVLHGHGVDDEGRVLERLLFDSKMENIDMKNKVCGPCVHTRQGYIEMPMGETYIGVGRGVDARGQLDVLEVGRVVVVGVDVAGDLLLPHQDRHRDGLAGHDTGHAEAEGAAAQNCEADGAG